MCVCVCVCAGNGIERESERDGYGRTCQLVNVAVRGPRIGARERKSEKCTDVHTGAACIYLAAAVEREREREMIDRRDGAAIDIDFR